MLAHMPAALDRFMPRPDVAKRHEILIHAPADLVMKVARNFDFRSIAMIRALFWLRARLLGGRPAHESPSTGFISDMLRLGWGRLVDESHLFIAGAACQPWLADVVFSPIAAENFAAFAEPDRVKIVWTLETESIGPEQTRFSTETRVLATDAQARAKFQSYWRIFSIGILLIRLFLLSGVRREAEHQWRSH